MIKVYLNNKCISIGKIEDIEQYRNEKPYHFTSLSELLKKIDEFEKERDSDNMYVVGDSEKILNFFPIIKAAGGLVVKNKNEVLLIFRYGKWDIPKGKAEVGESTEETALREVEEETGVTGLKIIKPLLPTFHSYRLEGKRVIKKTYWYEMSYQDDSNILPQVLENITIVKWLSKKDLPWAMMSSHASIIDLLNTSGYL